MSTETDFLPKGPRLVHSETRSRSTHRKDELSSEFKNPLHFDEALIGFLGYLEGTQKSAHTLKCYRLDLLELKDYLHRIEAPGFNSRTGDLDQNLLRLSGFELVGFCEDLLAQRLMTNTRRRRQITLKKFLHFFAARNRLPAEWELLIPTPLKVENVPMYFDLIEFKVCLQNFPVHNLQSKRDRLIFKLFAETGMLVSELVTLRHESFRHPEGVKVTRATEGIQSRETAESPNQSTRSIPLSMELNHEISEYISESGGDKPSFQGGGGISPYLFSSPSRGLKWGSRPLTPRAIENVFKAHASFFVSQLKLKKSEDFTPRSLRHSFVLWKLKQGHSHLELQKLLGLRTPYAFRIYEPVLQEFQKRKERNADREHSPELRSSF